MNMLRLRPSMLPLDEVRAAYAEQLPPSSMLSEATLQAIQGETRRIVDQIMIDHWLIAHQDGA